MPILASKKERLLAIGELILQRRQALKLTRMALAVKLGCALSTIQTWEKGKGLPGDLHRAALAEYLAIDPKELTA